MKRIFCFLLLLVFFSIPFGSQAAGKLTVTQEAFFVRPFSSYHSGYVYAELTNTGDRPVKFNGGMVEFFNPDGDSIESSNIYSCYPPILGPGEVGYIYNSTSVKEAEDKSYIDDYILTVTSKGENEDSVRYLPSEGEYGEVQRSRYSTEYRISATIENDTDQTLEKITVAIALYDAEDKLIYADSVSPYSVAVPAGQSIIFHTSVSRSAVEAWEEESGPAKIVTIAYSED